MQSGVIVIPKSVHADRIRQNFDVFDFYLTEEEMERLRSLDKAQPVGGRAEDVDRLLQALTW
jgi:2,5-diketo-D-gluconate reductase A